MNVNQPVSRLCLLPPSKWNRAIFYLFVLCGFVVREKLSLDRDHDIATTSLCVSLMCPVRCFHRSACKLFTHTHTALFAVLPGWVGTRKVKPIWILLKPETVSGSSTSWAICKSVPRSRQITMPAPHHSVFYRPNTLPATQPTTSRQLFRHTTSQLHNYRRRGYWLLTETGTTGCRHYSIVGESDSYITMTTNFCLMYLACQSLAVKPCLATSLSVSITASSSCG